MRIFQYYFMKSPNFRERHRGVEGWKTQEKGKHTMKPLPKNGFGPTYDAFPPPHQSHFLVLPKLVLEGARYSTFPPPPQNRTMRFCPPICHCPKNSEEESPLSNQFGSAQSSPFQKVPGYKQNSSKAPKKF